MRSFKNTTLTLPGGMLVIPVAIARATRDAAKVDRAVKVGSEYRAIRQVEVDAVTNEPIDTSDIAYGWRDGDGTFLALDRAELDRAREDAKLDHIAIDCFVPAAKLDPTLVRGAYYLMPQRRFPQVTKAMKMLAEAMRLEKRVAVAKLCLRDRQARCVIAPRGDTLMLYTMAWAEQLVEPDADVLAHATEKVTKAELTMARELVRATAADGESFDEMRDDMIVAVEKLSETGVRAAVATGATTAQVTKAADLLEALEASLSALKVKPKRKAKA